MTVRTMFDSPEFAGAVMAKDEAKVAGQAEKCSLKMLDQVSSLGLKSSLFFSSKVSRQDTRKIKKSKHPIFWPATVLR